MDNECSLPMLKDFPKLGRLYQNSVEILFKNLKDF